MFFSWQIIFSSMVEMLICFLAKATAFFIMSLLKDGSKLRTSKVMNEEFGVVFIFTNHSVIPLVFFRWLALVAFTTLLFILSKICLEILPVSLLLGFISLHAGLFAKFYLWSFKVMYAVLGASVCILLLSCSTSVVFASTLMLRPAGWFDFLYVVVTLSFISLL